MIDQQFTDATTAPRFKEREPVIGRRWGADDLVSGYFVQSWGTDGEAVLVETLDGERIALVGDTVHTVEAVMPADPMDTAGRHRLIEVDDEPTAVIPKDLLPLPGDDEETEPAVEWPEFEPVEGTLPETAVVEPELSRVSLVDAVAVRFENVGQNVIDHARVITKWFFATIAVLVFAGVGIAWWLS